MWNEEGGDGEHRVVPSEPDLVGPVPGQAREFRLFMNTDFFMSFLINL